MKIVEYLSDEKRNKSLWLSRIERRLRACVVRNITDSNLGLSTDTFYQYLKGVYLVL